MGLYNPQSRLIFKGHKWLNYSQITVCLSVCLYLRVYGDGTYSLLKKKFITKPMKQCFSYNIVLCCDMICDSAMLVKRWFIIKWMKRRSSFKRLCWWDKVALSVTMILILKFLLIFCVWYRKTKLGNQNDWFSFSFDIT